jgi:hypothetical protein
VLAGEVLHTWEQGGDTEAANILARQSSNPVESLTDTVAATAARCVEQLDDHRPAAAVWALARAYADIGRHPIAAEILSMVPSGTPVDLAEIQLLNSFVAASRDRYRDAQDCARDARCSAKQIDGHRLRTGFKTRAALQLAYAHVLHHNLRVVPPVSEDASVPRSLVVKSQIRKVLARVNYVLTLARNTPRGARAIRASTTAPFGVTSDDYRVACDYIESLIRMQAFAGGILTVARRRRILRRIDKLSLQSGYLTGALNCEKYLRRLPGDDLDMSIRGRLAVLNDQVAAAIELRDRALQSREALMRLSQEAVGEALLAGLPSIALQIEVARRNAGMMPVLVPEEVKNLVSSIQATPVEAISEKLIASLVGPFD